MADRFQNKLDASILDSSGLGELQNQGFEQGLGDCLKLIISYDGTAFHGFQYQPGLRTVQGVLTETLQKVLQHDVVIEGSGRTDAGVHARAQVVSCKVQHHIPEQRWPIAMNTRLPSDLVVTSAAYMPDAFHARFSSVAKTYRYTIDRGSVADVFRHRYAFHHPRPFSVERIVEASQHLIGTHDFTTFSGTHTHVINKVRTLYGIHIEEHGPILHMYFTGSGFLYNMVRILTGTLIQIGYRRWQPSEIKSMILAKDRRKAGLTAPPHGLSLWSVYYTEAELTDFLQSMASFAVT